MMKKWLSLSLTLLLLFGLIPFAMSEGTGAYQLGDRMDDFSATLSDGTQVSLYGLLQEKKAVLINLWASWCGPCKNEFPFMEQAYQEMSDEIGIIALSCEVTDTDEIVLALKQELGLDTLPMGLDVGLAQRFGLEAYPTSIMVDRNGVICFIEAGSIPDKNKFLRLFSVFTEEGYADPVLLSEIPTAKPSAEQPSADVLGKALGLADERIAVEPITDESAWPFVPAQDASCAQASNGDEMETKAALTLSVTAEAGEALQYDYALFCPAVLDSLTVSVDGEALQYYGGELDWRIGYVPFASSGAHTVVFVFQRGTSAVAEASAQLRNVKMISAEEKTALDALAVQPPKTLTGVECDISLVEGAYKDVVITEVSGQSDEGSKTTVAMVQPGEIMLRVRIGADVDERYAYVGDATKGVLLVNLPHDEQGFLYRATVTSMAEGNPYPYNSFVVSSSALDMVNSYTQSFMCFASEADVDEYINMIKELAAAYGMTDYQMVWEYADGSPKQGAETDAVSAATSSEAEYRIVVLDDAGAPVAGAMIQICDEGTCQVAVTDDQGVVTHKAAPYPFEIHLLKAPDGYAPDAQTYVMPEEGGELVITLQKQ